MIRNYALLLLIISGLSQPTLGFAGDACHLTGPSKKAVSEKNEKTSGPMAVDNSIGLDLSKAEHSSLVVDSVACPQYVVIPFLYDDDRTLVFNLMGADKNNCTYSRILPIGSNTPGQFIQYTVDCRRS